MSDTKAGTAEPDQNETPASAIQDTTGGGSTTTGPDTTSAVNDETAGEDIIQSQEVNETGESAIEDAKQEPKAKYSRGGDNGDRPNKKRKHGYDNQSKFDPSVLPESNDPDEIRKQVEFYFSDSNLPTDNFLFTQVGGSENKPIPIKVIHSFKRMRHFQPYSAVVNALKESSILEVTEKEEIRRKVPLDPSIGKSAVDNVKIIEDKAQPRSVYAKGFGKEEPSTQFDIEAFFMPYGPINAIRLRRTHPDKVFKGSVFVEFDNEETQKAFLALDPKPKWNGEELQILSKKEYVDQKAQDIRDGKILPNEPRQSHQHQNRGRGRGRGGKNFGGRDRRDRDRGGADNRGREDWKGRRDDFQKNGFKDRKRDDHKNGDRDSKGAETTPKKRYDARGVPIVETESGSTEGATNGSAKQADATAAESKKRGRDENGPETDSNDVKKVKVATDAAAA